MKKPAKPARAPTYDDVLAIVRLIESGSRFSEFRLRSGDIEVDIKRTTGAADASLSAAPPVAAQGPAPAGAPPNAPAPVQADLPPVPVGVRSPLVGILYRAP